MDVQTPDEFLQYQWEIGDPDFLLGVFGDWASHLTNPPLALEELLERLARASPRTSARWHSKLSSVEIPEAER